MERAAGLECNICCGSAEDPVITLCGHLHCRPCLHGRDECPVCKAAIKEEELIPLHGSGSNTPRRPSGGLLWRRRGFIPVAQVQVGVATDQRQSLRLPDAQSGVSGYGSFGEDEQSNNNNGHYLKKILLFILVFVVFDFLII